MSLPIDDTITALATPLFPSGVGVIRISGPDAVRIADRVFEGKQSVRECVSHTVLYGYLRDPGSGTRLDKVICLPMKKPRSYTGDDVVELSMHGNPFLLRKAVDIIVSCGARQAEAGEFTYRAFMNGKMSLTQAEAVHQLVSARSESGLQNAFSQLQGSLQKRIGSIRARVFQILSECEADIEFPDQGLSFSPGDALMARIRSIVRQLSDAADTYAVGKKLEAGVTIAVCGPPNSGKSTLVNRLLREERAIVHEIPGTTRDLVEGTTAINGALLRIVDTAGLRETGDAVEKIGMRRTHAAIKRADLIFWVDTVTERNGSSDTLFRHVRGLVLKRQREAHILRLRNKSDLLDDGERRRIIRAEKDSRCLVISAKRGWGISRLRREISRTIDALNVDLVGGTIITSMRQRQLLRGGCNALRHAVRALRRGDSLEYISHDLNECIRALDQFTGTQPQGDLYELIFRNFCVGK